MNLSSYILSDTEVQLLSKGLQFSIPPLPLDQTDTMTTFELLYNQAAPGIKGNFNRLKHRLKTLCYQYIFTNKDNIPTLSKGELLAFKQLSTNNNIVITKPDKGN